MKKSIKLNTSQYERLISLRDHEKPSLTMTAYVKERFNGRLKHRYDDRLFKHYESKGISVTYPYSYRAYEFTVIFDYDDERFTWFMLHV
jgi:hypothetical protein